MIQVRELYSDRYEEYDRALRSFPNASAYHTRGWMELIARVVGAEPLVLIAFEGNEIKGALPLALQKNLLGGRRLVTLPFSHRVPPLGDMEIIGKLIQRAVQFCLDRGCSFYELRDETTAEHLMEDFRFVNTELSIPSTPMSLEKQFRANTRNKIQQALRNPKLTLRLASETKDYQAMDDLMGISRRSLGSLTYPKGFFQKLAQSLKLKLRCELCLFEGRPIAMMVTSLFGRIAIHHYGASTNEKELRRLRPNNLLVWEALKWAQIQGADIFDFGTSLPSQKGLITFKEGFGGKTKPLLYRMFTPENKPTYRPITQNSLAAKWATHLLKVTPLSIHKQFTPILLKYLG